MGYKQYCKDYENIENYDKAKADNFKGWECHHRLETHTSDGERRLVDITQAELKALNMYYNRPASELIFLTRSEHHAYKKGESNPMYGKQGYWKGKKLSEDTRKKLSEANKGKQGYWKGKKLSEEAKKKMSESHKGKPRSEETRRKISESAKGKTKSEEHKKKLSESHKGNTNTKGMRWFNNGKINTMAKECPDGFVPGRLS